MDPVEIIFLSVVVAVSFFSQSLLGFGAGVIAIPILSLLLPVRDSVLFMLPFQFLMGLLVIRTYSRINWRTFGPLMLGMCLGVPLGTHLLATLDDSVLRYILAITVLLFVARRKLFPSYTFGASSNLFVPLVVGLIFGALHSLTGSAGPVIVMYLLGAITDRNICRATMIFVQAAGNAIRLVSSATASMLNPAMLWPTVAIFPLFLVAIFAGEKFHAKVSEKLYGQLVNILLIASAVSLLLKA